MRCCSKRNKVRISINITFDYQFWMAIESLIVVCWWFLHTHVHDIISNAGIHDEFKGIKKIGLLRNHSKKIPKKKCIQQLLITINFVEKMSDFAVICEYIIKLNCCRTVVSAFEDYLLTLENMVLN